jgi:hypothetical protein
MSLVETSNKVKPLPVTRHAPVADVFSDPAAFEHAQRVAKVFASSKLVPPHLHGNVADCLIAYQIARRLNEEPLTVFQNIYVVSGRPGWKTEYCIARANKAGVFSGRITWESAGKGDDLAVTAKAVLADTGEEIRVTCDMRMAKAEQWTRNAKYTSMPEHMLRWRSAAMLIRLYAPEVMLGMPVLEEIETLPQAEMRDVTPAKSAAQALDEFAAEVAAAEVQQADTTQAGAEASQDTGDAAAEADQRAAAEPEDAPQDGAATEQQAAPPAAQRPPGNEREYVAHFDGWLAASTDPGEMFERWNEEMTARNRCHISPETRDALKARLDARIAELGGGKANGSGEKGKK